jgi:hypothetical protein
MKTRFLGQAYQSRSPILASQTAINIYPESSEENSDQVGAFYGTPGLQAFFTGTGSVRGMRVAGGALFAVIGSALYRIRGANSSTNLGLIPGVLPVSMTDNGSQIAVAHELGWEWVDLTGSAVASVAGAPTGSIVTTQDNYVLFTDGGGKFGITALGDLSSIAALDVATAEGLPDDLVGIISDHREVWLPGAESIEIWTDTGAAFFPFERAPGGFIEQGCAAGLSLAKLDNSVFWIGADEHGQGIVYRANAYIPERISTHALEHAINGYGNISDAIGFSYQEEGHLFYWLTFPSADASWVYDVATKAWHQRAGLDTSTGLLHRHRANCYAFFQGKHLVGDFENGIIYEMSLDIGTDNGSPIYRERAWDIADDEGKKGRGDILELVAITGDGDTRDVTSTSAGAPSGFWDAGFWNPGFWWTGFWDGFIGTTITVTHVPIAPVVWLEISRDGGRKWGYRRQISLGLLGQTLARARWRRLGTGRDVVLRVATTMQSRVHWVGANLKGEGYDS